MYISVKLDLTVWMGAGEQFMTHINLWSKLIGQKLTVKVQTPLFHPTSTNG